MTSKRLSIEEQIEKKEESIKQLQNQKRQLKKKLNEQERKARNKRLIEKGAVCESIFEESTDLTKDEFYKLIKMLNDEEIRLNIMEIFEERIDDCPLVTRAQLYTLKGACVPLEPNPCREQQPFAF